MANIHGPVLLALAASATQFFGFLVFRAWLADASHVPQSLEEPQACPHAIEQVSGNTQNMLQAVSHPKQAVVQRWPQQEAKDSADVVVTLREALRLTGFKIATVDKGAASFSRQSRRDSMRIAYLLTGDAFRNSQVGHDPYSCSAESEEPQRIACQSHLSNIIKPMEAAGYQVSLYGVTYPCSGGESLVQSLPDMFDGYMKGFALTTRSNFTTGGQVTSWRAAVSQVMTDISNDTGTFDYYIISRWDLKVDEATTPEYWKCVFDGKRVARHLGHLCACATEDCWQKGINMDMMLMVHGSLMENLYSMLWTDSEKCCSTQAYGLACIPCADNLNAEASATDPAPIACPGLEGSLKLSKTAPMPTMPTEV